MRAVHTCHSAARDAEIAVSFGERLSDKSEVSAHLYESDYLSHMRVRMRILRHRVIHLRENIWAGYGGYDPAACVTN